MVGALTRVFGPTRDEYFAIIGLYGAETDRNVEVDVQQLSGFPVTVN